jgi:hypothetical protein
VRQKFQALLGLNIRIETPMLHVLAQDHGHARVNRLHERVGFCGDNGKRGLRRAVQLVFFVQPSKGKGLATFQSNVVRGFVSSLPFPLVEAVGKHETPTLSKGLVKGLLLPKGLFLYVDESPTVSLPPARHCPWPKPPSARGLPHWPTSARCWNGKSMSGRHTGRLVNDLVEAKDARTLGRVVGRYSRLDLLILDELGYLPLSRTDAELLFQVLSERHER